MLRTYLDGLSRSDRFVIMDNEAGMEHLSRRTTRDVDHLFVMAEPTVLGLRSAQHIISLARSLHTGMHRVRLVFDRTGADGIGDELDKIIAERDVTARWFLPRSRSIEAISASAARTIGEGITLEGMESIVREVQATNRC
jgi:CO dehydrogenase maturation factor